jgi:hypothetical protein
MVDKWLSPTQGDQRLFVELSQEAPRSPSPPGEAVLNDEIYMYFRII